MKTSKKPLISVIIPAHNSAKTLSRCLKSILKNTRPADEIIVVENGSTDNTLDVSLRFKNQGVAIYSVSDASVGHARNYGLMKANAEYVMFVDADDELDKNCIKKIEEVIFAKRPGAIRYGGLEETDHGFKKIETAIGGGRLPKEKIEKLVLGEGNFRCYSPLLVLKNEEIIPFDEEQKYLEDSLFYYQNLRDRDIVFLDYPGYIYRYNRKSSTKNPQNADIVLNDIHKAAIKLKMLGANKKKIKAFELRLMISKLTQYLQCMSFADARDLAKKTDSMFSCLINNYRGSCEKLSSFQKLSLWLLKNRWYGLLICVSKFKKIRGLI